MEKDTKKLDKIRDIISKIFHVPIEGVGDNPSQETINGWDSLGHLNLILSIEEEFGVTFSSIEIANMKSLIEIASTIKKYKNEGK